MIVTMHALSTMHCNIVTEIRLAGETGYDGFEMMETKLLRYLDQGFEARSLTSLLRKYKIKPVTINALKSIERVKAAEKKRMLAECERLCKAAAIIGCPTIQLVPFCGLEGKPYKEVLRLTAKNISEIADIGDATQNPVSTRANRLVANSLPSGKASN